MIATLLFQISIVQASYGANAGAPLGNATAQLAAACNGSPGPCVHTVIVPPYPDPVPGKQKDYRASWTCGGGPVQTVVLPAGVGWNLGVGQQGPQSVLTLTCTPANPPGSPCTNWPPLLRLDLTPYTELAPNAAGVLSWPDGKAAEIWLRTSATDATLKKYTLQVKP